MIHKSTKTQQSDKILVADDDPAILDALKMMLELHNYNVETISDGLVLQRIRGKRPRLVLLDILMSGVDGRDICKQMKQQKETKDIPVILISATQNIRQSTKDAGANDFLPKPFDVEDLLSKVAKHYAATN